MVVEIFQSGSPARCDRKFSASAQGPARAHSQNLLLATGQVRFQQPRLRPGEAPGRVEKPVVRCVTRSAANRRDEVELFGDGAGRSCPGRDDAVIEIIRKRDISLNSDKQPRRQQIIVTYLQTAKEATERGNRSRRVRIEL